MLQMRPRCLEHAPLGHSRRQRWLRQLAYIFWLCVASDSRLNGNRTVLNGKNRIVAMLMLREAVLRQL